MARTPQTPDGAGSSSTVVSDPETSGHASGHAKWGISLAVILGALTTSVMRGSLNVALPTMMTSLRAEVTQIQWVLTAFMITRTVMMPTLGWVGGMVGNRRLYLTCLTLYMGATMLCGLAWNIETMITFRIIQAMSAGYLFPLTLTILHETFPPNQRGLAMGMFMAGMSIGPAVGPWLGGYLIEHVSWRAIFYVHLPTGIIALALAAAILPAGEQQRQRSTVDLLGLITLASFVVSLLLAVSQARDYGWDSRYILTLLAIAGVGLLAFVTTELTCDTPLVDLRIYTNVQFALASMVTFFNSLTNFGMNFVMALFLQRALGFTPQQAGEIMLPAALGWGLTSLFSGRLADKVQGRWLILGGSLTLAVIFYLFTTINAWTGAWAIAMLLICRSLARGFIQSPILTVVMSTLPDDQVRMGAGLRGLLNSLGGTFGVALAGFWLQQRLAVQTRLLQENQHLSSFDSTHLIESVRQQLLQAGEVGLLLQVKINAVLNRWLAQEAATIAYHDVFVITATVVLLAALPILWLRSSRTP
jgi:DHA2 family multidrug resistance protein